MGCPRHGNGVDPVCLVGRRIERVLGSWHVYDGVSVGPLDVWLGDDHGAWTQLTTGSDWCLITESTGPFESYDMGEYGRIDVRPIRGETPLAGHVGETVIGVRDEFESTTGRVGLEVIFASGTVYFDSESGDLHVKG